VRRREFITLLGGAAAWPFAAHAQEREKVRRIGVMASLAADDRVAQVRNGAFLQGLQQAGWNVGRNVSIEYRWAGIGEAARRHAAELVALAPDVILAGGSQAATPLLQITQTIPVVFVHTPDPVGSGLVSSLAQPGGNATGFTQFEYGIAGKWLELLKPIQSVAPVLGMQVIPINLQIAAEIERSIADFARTPNGGLIVTGSGLSVFHLNLLVKLAAQHKLLAVYYERSFVAAGGSISYGPDLVDQYRHAAGYVDRILKGEKPANLPVQAPTRYETVINLRTAKTLGITMPPSVLARADEVIE
jgi:putative ABC transport system substrate-binding protein